MVVEKPKTRVRVNGIRRRAEKVSKWALSVRIIAKREGRGEEKLTTKGERVANLSVTVGNGE